MGDVDNKIVPGKSNILSGCSSFVRTFCVKDNLLINCSYYDKTINIWDIDDISTNKYNYKCVQILTGHTGYVNTICVKDNLIISGSSDKTIRIWDMINTNTNTNTSTNKYDYKCVQILTGHTNYVMSMCVKDNLIISGSSDKTIRVWNRDDNSTNINTNINTNTNKYDYKCVQVLTGHNGFVRTICVKDNLIISGSSDNTIRIWDVTNTSTNKYDYKCIQVLKGHTDCINTICVKDNLIISGSDNGEIRIWDMTNTNSDTSTNKYDYKCVKVLKGHTGFVRTICVKDSLIISGSEDKTIRIWNRDDNSTNISTNKYNYKCVQILERHTDYVMSLCVKDNLIISGCYDKTIRVTPINLFLNELHIFKILINNYHLVSYLQTEILDYFRSGVA